MKETFLAWINIVIEMYELLLKDLIWASEWLFTILVCMLIFVLSPVWILLYLGLYLYIASGHKNEPK